MDSFDKLDKLKEQYSSFIDNFSVDAFWDTVKKHAKTVGCEGIRNGLRLFYALDNPKMPAKIKMSIYGALGYFISPLDVIPDFMPIVGFTDDIGILAAAVGIAALYIDSDVKDKADRKLADWFGDTTC